MTSAPNSRRRADLRLLMAGRLLRAFGFGFAIVLLGVHLQNRRLSPAQIGLVLAVGLTAAALSSLVAAVAARRFGNRRTLSAIGLLMFLCGTDLAFANNLWLLLLAAATGMIGAASTDTGPFLAVEQAILTDAASPEERNRAFARYALSGAAAGAAGAFSAGLGTDLWRTQAFFALYGMLGLATAAIPFLLSDRVEHGATGAPVFGSIRPLFGLAALFSLDSFGGGLVTNSLLVYLLHIRFGTSPAVLGPAFGVMSLLGALSFELSGRIADRIGLVRTMIFTHLPSSLLLLAIPLLPTDWSVLGVLILRSCVSSMDQPARGAYVVSIVKPGDRSGALAFIGATRGVAGGAGSALSGVAIQSSLLGLPFIVGGVLKTVYDTWLYFGYRSRYGDHETAGRN